MLSRPPLILAYHGLGDVPPAQDPHRLFVAPERFAGQIAGLRRRGYEFATVGELARRRRAGARVGGLCAVTFDDGGADNADVLPVLIDRLRLPVTLYVCPGLLGQPHPFLAREAGLLLMDADQLRAMALRPGVEIGSHTSAHRDLSDAGPDEALREMAGSKAELEALIDTEVVSFAYPFCSYSAACPDAATRAGYTSAVTCGPRGGRGLFELRRDMIGAADGRLRFALKSHGAAHAARRPKRWLARLTPSRAPRAAGAPSGTAATRSR